MSTITDNDRRIQYTTAGGESSFSYDFQIDDADHVEVYRDGVLQTRGTHYSVIGVGDSNGGDIVPDGSLTIAAGEVWTIEGDTPEDRSNDYSGFTTVKPATVDADLDRMIFMAQQFRRDINRSIRIGIEDATDEEALRLPGSVARAGKNLAFDENGDIVAVDSFASGATTPGDISASVAEADLIQWDDSAQKFIPGPNRSDVPKTVDSVSALQSGSFPASLERIWLSGYYGVGTAGGGPLYRDSDDTTTADNGGTVFVDADGVRWKRPEIYSVEPEIFGATGDGATDDDTAIQAWLTYGLDNGKSLFLPPNTYLYSTTLKNESPVTVLGSGASSILKFDGDGNAVELRSGSTLLRDFLVEAGSGSHVHGITNDPAYSSDSGLQQSHVENVRVKDFTNGSAWRFAEIWEITFVRCDAVASSIGWEFWEPSGGGGANDVCLVGCNSRQNSNEALLLNSNGFSFNIFGGNWSNSTTGAAIRIPNPNMNANLYSPYIEGVDIGIHMELARGCSILDPFISLADKGIVFSDVVDCQVLGYFIANTTLGLEFGSATESVSRTFVRAGRIGNGVTTHYDVINTADGFHFDLKYNEGRQLSCIKSSSEITYAVGSEELADSSGQTLQLDEGSVVEGRVWSDNGRYLHFYTDGTTLVKVAGTSDASLDTFTDGHLVLRYNNGELQVVNYTNETTTFHWDAQRIVDVS